MKYRKIPTSLAQFSSSRGSLRVKDFLAIASFEHTAQSKGAIFLEEHLLLFVLQGTNTLIHGNQKYVVHKDQMILLPKATVWEYNKEVDKGSELYDSMLFFIKDEFLKDFMKMAEFERIEPQSATVRVRCVSKHLKAYLSSIKPYFENAECIASGLLRLKMMELLYDLALTDKDLLSQILQLKQPRKTEIISIMEQNYTLHLSLPQFAYLSGRSLSSFKRDFMAIYNTAPSKWIRTKRLEKAKELLSTTMLDIVEIAYMSGFENLSHFSRIFKEEFGCSPSKYRRIEPNRKEC